MKPHRVEDSTVPGEKSANLCTSLCMNGGQQVDDARNPGGNEKVPGITLCFSKYPLTRGFVTYLLMLVPKSARRPER